MPAEDRDITEYWDIQHRGFGPDWITSVTVKGDHGGTEDGALEWLAKERKSKPASTWRVQHVQITRRTLIG